MRPSPFSPAGKRALPGLVAVDAARRAGEEVAAEAARREAENEERVEQLKKLGKNIPVIGPVWGALVDLGAWIGKQLGGNYEDQYGPEDLEHVAQEVTAWVERGWIPPDPALFLTGKYGAKDFGNILARRRGYAQNLSTERFAHLGDRYFYDDKDANTRALATIGKLTLKHAGNPLVVPAIRAVANSMQGTFYQGRTASDDVAARLVGALVAAEVGVELERYQRRAVTIANEVDDAMRKGSVNPHPIDPAAPFPTQFERSSFKNIAGLADTFVTLMREASAERPLVLVSSAYLETSAQVEAPMSTTAKVVGVTAGAAAAGVVGWALLRHFGKLGRPKRARARR